MMDAAPGAGCYGVFSLAGMQLALPLDALREVVPRQALINLPCGNPAVIGGIDLRGLLVPMLDLRRQLQMDSTTPAQTVVIMTHEGRLLGLLAESVTGVFSCAADELHAIDATDGHNTLLTGSFSHIETAVPISILNPAAITALPDTPLVDDPQQGQDSDAAPPADAPVAETGAAHESYVLLMRCGGLPLAMASTRVHSTVLNPHVHPSTLASGYCLGSIEYADLLVPAVDLTQLCGLGVRGKPAQAFVVQYPQGLVAFMVEEIMDVVSADPRLATAVPPQSLPHAEFFDGVLPTSVLPADTAQLPAASHGFYFLLSGEALANHAKLITLSQMNTTPDGKVVLRGDNQDDTPRDSGMHGKMLTYDLGGGAIATPIEQISEILPWSEATTLLGEGGPALGLMMNRGNAIPTFCLSTLTGQPRAPLTPTASVLVVENQGGMIGFTVPHLISIEEAAWAPQEDIDALARHAKQTEASKDVRQCWGRVLVAQAGDERMLNLLDLHHLATMVLHPQPA
ncbi:purine-binding chemotaxis protein CheW [Andreprevotia lacus DSM 23236]|jgi:purine-binding chemotaxis protein CheW|uniref:Purine-binding chemotaxis protein CheW n=1 Tax=Andreprevotia lacus DSM 23236 TaxID=1121001 RepID=A0A1W1XW31_9NEIS|nr:chemotaxis protein CheW [Andreprevotia lacus]SMC28044.1 purine-binding chemotaxis protein CheW [Andreprevotia lacus DSM 23236]